MDHSQHQSCHEIRTTIFSQAGRQRLRPCLRRNTTNINCKPAPRPDAGKGQYLGGATTHACFQKHRKLCTNKEGCRLGRVSDSCLENTTRTDKQIRIRGLMINMIRPRGAPAASSLLLRPPLSHPSQLRWRGAPSLSEPKLAFPSRVIHVLRP